MASTRRVLAIASTGGHWVQLRRLRPAWDGCPVMYATTDAGHREEVMRDAAARGQPVPRFRTVREANRWQKWRLIRQFLGVLWLLVTFRPHVIVTTGAAPGFFAVFAGHYLGMRTVWIDSVANGEELSLSGKRAGRFATLWLTQWESLSTPDGPRFAGTVL
ncbi:UDP-N-acetylglucosamine--LPS N-acetylglucosamine transferase [Roseospira navarrensis]|uniref:UDP-N-acetylglucosamine--LPS N-acetylglucosamine transferase n=1 Tax=Roseospira navarrensis TaxID=140058 RepID=A0A7X2D4S9_9PROT|nr:UDP-N-acetylglucosamine--LPS N-acetylglucosamine transferase [Roseospira navarrensis]MQX38243.1 UDP-N-acetylglucosamine--LPS N-acetylglucosamine transferase [Roseospira navarrensis]